MDAKTGKPIEEAVVFISWRKTGSGPPGLAGNVQVEAAEDLTDTEGLFYSTLFKDYHMVVYKQGYVCWNSEKVFPTYEQRKDFRLKKGMLITLERFKQEYSREDHARFTIFSKVGISESGLFDEAVKAEKELFRKIFKRNRRR
ncbi:MAG: carboxypeptidase regulatory-like domain-containing protein [Methanosarcinales archaeon]|nr:carboxypeptidase regulatory-like domain-containing protein [Methanosarcinales archaeon]